jgi:deoxyribose-phosphate aldolase
MIDHTLLKPEATAADVNALTAEATKLGTYSACVSSSMLPLTIPACADLKVAVVCGSPQRQAPQQHQDHRGRSRLSPTPKPSGILSAT